MQIRDNICLPVNGGEDSTTSEIGLKFSNNSKDKSCETKKSINEGASKIAFSALATGASIFKCAKVDLD